LSVVHVFSAVYGIGLFYSVQSFSMVWHFFMHQVLAKKSITSYDKALKRYSLLASLFEKLKIGG